MSSSRALQLLKGSATLRPTAKGCFTFVRNAGGGPAVEHQLPPFPPGPRQMEQAKNWLGSLTVFGATAFTALCYFSDWRVICEYIPFYNGKYKKDE